MMQRRKGFTLIELLVVIAILALLVSVLMPAIAKARMAGRKVVSLANIGQIGLAARMYADDNQGFMPITLCYPRGTTDIPTFFGWCTWSFGGKNCDPYWRTWQGGVFDVEAADRPLNPYMYPDLTFDAPAPPTALPANDPARKLQQAYAFRDPSDKYSRQGAQWPEEKPNVSSYDDVGTSYHWSYRWYYGPFPPLSNLNPLGNNLQRRAVFNWGMRQMRTADNFMPARFVWVYDQMGDVVVNADNRFRNFVNGYGDINRSILGFLDGHGAYLPMIRGETSGPNYTLLFSYQRQ